MEQDTPSTPVAPCSTEAASEIELEIFPHSPDVLALHFDFVDTYIKCTRELLAKDNADKRIEEHVSLARTSYQNRAAKEETCYECHLPATGELENAVNFGCKSINFTTNDANGQPMVLKLPPGLREGSEHGEVMVKLLPEMNNNSYEGVLSIRPKTANEMVLETLQLLRDHPERFPIETAVQLFDLQESDMQDYRGEVELSAPLNAGQLAAWKMVMANRASIVWGPPGTGKSHLICEVINGLLQRGLTITLLSNTNDAIDSVAKKLVQIATKNEESLIGKAFTDHRITRYGTPKKPRSLSIIAYSNRKSRASLEKKEDNLPSQSESMEKDSVSIATGFRFISNRVESEEPNDRGALPIRDVVVIDEISTVNQPLIYIAACYARQKIVIVGDDRQLPVIFSYRNTSTQTRGAYGNTIIKFLGLRLDDMGDGRGLDRRMSVLTEQRRMPDALAALVRATNLYPAYTTPPDHALSDHSKVALHAGPGEGRAFIIIDTQDSYAYAQENRNQSHVDLVKRLVTHYLGIPKMGNIGIICPYKNQAQTYWKWLRPKGKKDKKKLRNVEHVSAGTVHSYQGSEAPLIIWDTVESPSPDPTEKRRHYFTDDKSEENEGSSAINLMNVAVSRAQGKLVVVANVSYLSKNLTPGCFLHSLIRMAKEQDSIIPAGMVVKQLHLMDAPEALESNFDPQPFIVPIKSLQEQLKYDAQRARNFIAIYSPNVDIPMMLTVAKWFHPLSLEKNMVIEFYTKKNVNKETRAAFEEIMNRNKQFFWRPSNEWPFSHYEIVFDDRVFYRGAPSLLNKEVHPALHRSLA